MSLPRLRARLEGGPAFARLLRGALRHEVEVVPLVSPPLSGGQHLLEIEIEGEIVLLLADPAGPPDGDAVPLHVRPVTRPQMATLLALIERLDVPSQTIPPPDAGRPLSLIPDYGDETVAERSRNILGHDLTDPPPFFVEGTPSSSPPQPLLPTALSLKPPAVPVFGPDSGVSGPATDPMIGHIVANKYQLEAAIGSGMTAAVYRAMHVDLQRALAVKILHHKKRDDNQFVKRFRGEALAASRLEHPNVTRVIDFGQEPDGLLYLVMELLTGRSLEAILAVSGALPPRVAVTYAIQACGALACAHDEGIIHRDVKPENIMIVAHRDDDGNPCDLAKVCDFGLAKLRDAKGEDLTTGGMLCGSPAYMSPEQARGEALDGRSDIYSLGVTLYECLSGEFPYESATLSELFIKKLMHPPRKLSVLVPSIDPLLEDIVMRALSADPGSRHPNARVLREELRVALTTTLDEDVPSHEGWIVAD